MVQKSSAPQVAFDSISPSVALGETESPDTFEAIREVGAFLKRADRIQAASKLLQNWVEITPNHAFRYNLACYEALLGNFDHARSLLAAEFAQDPSMLEMALVDDDLSELHCELQMLAPASGI